MIHKVHGKVKKRERKKLLIQAFASISEMSFIKPLLHMMHIIALLKLPATIQVSV